MCLKHVWENILLVDLKDLTMTSDHVSQEKYILKTMQTVLLDNFIVFFFKTEKLNFLIPV